MCLMYAQRNGTNDDINNPKLMKLNPTMTIPPNASSVKPNPAIKQVSLLNFFTICFNVHTNYCFFFG